MFVYVCRDMAKSVNPKYTPPSRDYFSNKLIPSWYKSDVITELSDVCSVALKCGG